MKKFLFLFLLLTSHIFGYEYDLTIGSIFQDEAPYLKEWIEFHRMIGVQHFILVNDRSSDNYMDVLKPYIQSGIVEFYDIPCPSHLDGVKWTSHQIHVISKIVNVSKGISRWLALIDIDEFIVPTEKDNLFEFLEEYEDYDRIYIRWEPFGTSFIKKIPEGTLMTENLILKWKFRKGHNILGKSIVRPEKVQYPNVHSCAMYKPFKALDSNPDMLNENPKIKINHYWTRDEFFLLNVKKPRAERIKGNLWSDEKIEIYKKIYNDVVDTSMERFLPELRLRVFN